MIIINKTKSLKEFFNINKLKSRLVIDGIIIGIIGGTLSVLYRLMLSYLGDIRFSLYHDEKNIFILIGVLIISSFVIYRLVKWEPLSSGSGIPQIQGELIDELDMNENKVLASKYIGGGLANLVGLSLGREGPSIQIGAAGAKFLAKILKRDSNEQKYMITAGASAGLAAAFNAPISGTLFALEEMHKNFSTLVLLPCIIASVIADFISKNMFGLEPAFSFKTVGLIPLEKYHTVIMLGIFSGLIGVLFNKVILGFQSIYSRVAMPPFAKMLVVMLIAAAVGFSYYDLLGGGHDLLEMIAVEMIPFKMILIYLIGKLLFTGISYGSGAQGGIFLPVLVLGGLSGACAFSIIGNFVSISDIYYTNFIILGMAAVLTAVARSPIISILLVSEMTGSFHYILGLCLVSIIAYLTAEFLREKPIYHSLLERILSKNRKEISEDVIRYSEKVLLEYRIPVSGMLVNRKLMDIIWPCELLIVAIERNGRQFIPIGSDELKAGDLITVFSSNKNTAKLDDFFKFSEER